MASIRSANMQQLTIPQASYQIQSSTAQPTYHLQSSVAQPVQQQVVYAAPQQVAVAATEAAPVETSVNYETYEVEQPVTYQIQKVENVEVLLKHRYKVPITTQKFISERTFRGDPQLIGTERSNPVIHEAQIQPCAPVQQQQQVQYMVQQPQTQQYVIQTPAVQPVQYTQQSYSTQMPQQTGYTLQRSQQRTVQMPTSGYSYQMPGNNFEGVKTFN